MGRNKRSPANTNGNASAPPLAITPAATTAAPVLGQSQPLTNGATTPSNNNTRSTHGTGNSNNKDHKDNKNNNNHTDKNTNARVFLSHSDSSSDARLFEDNRQKEIQENAKASAPVSDSKLMNSLKTLGTFVYTLVLAGFAVYILHGRYERDKVSSALGGCVITSTLFGPSNWRPYVLVAITLSLFLISLVAPK